MSSGSSVTTSASRRRTATAMILSIVARSALAFSPSAHRPSRPLSPITCPSKTAYLNNRQLHARNTIQLMATKSDEDLEKEVSAMRAKDIRQELESYGVSTKSFFEKSELVEALVKARKEGKTPISDGANSDTTAASSESSSNSGAGNRQERIQQEMEECKKMKVGALKKELESYGISTKSYFEKSEFVRAVAEARVDGPKKGASAGGKTKEEPRDPSYRDVVVSKFSGSQGLLGQKIIDVRARS